MRGSPASLGLRRRIGETGAVCSSVRANSAKESGDEFGVRTAVERELDEGGGCTSKGVGVGVFCALRACNALRRYSDLGATVKDPVRVTVGLARSGVDGF